MHHTLQRQIYASCDQNSQCNRNESMDNLAKAAPDWIPDWVPMDNQFFSGGLGLAAIGFGMTVLRSSAGVLQMLARRHLMVTLEVNRHANPESQSSIIPILPSVWIKKDCRPSWCFLVALLDIPAKKQTCDVSGHQQGCLVPLGAAMVKRPRSCTCMHKNST